MSAMPTSSHQRARGIGHHPFLAFILSSEIIVGENRKKCNQKGGAFRCVRHFFAKLTPHGNNGF
ncbi:hypothetical protein I656_03231 [Geobacillus sp. WSUCF1]|nr:hypothetical protein I656_03231 [Geobacillus sp. WSUCF1]